MPDKAEGDRGERKSLGVGPGAQERAAEEERGGPKGSGLLSEDGR